LSKPLKPLKRLPNLLMSINPIGFAEDLGKANLSSMKQKFGSMEKGLKT
jgi:hypothetical protein